MTKFVAARKPGEDLVEQGLRDLSRGVESVESLLICIGAPRLRACGIAVPHEPTNVEFPEMRLYRLLLQQGSDDAHSRYNALVRRLVSYERAVELELGRARRRA